MADDFDYDPNNDEEMADEEELDEEEQEGEEDQEDEKHQEDEKDQKNVEQKEVQVYKRRDLNKFKKIIKTAPYRFYPYLTNSEKKLVQKMKKSGYVVEVARLNQLMQQRKQAFWAKVKSTITPALPFIGYMLLAVFIIIIVVAIIGHLFPWLFPDDENLGGSKGASSPFGMKGDKFYGGRVVYRDDVRAQNGLIEQYVDIVETSIEGLQAETFTEIVKVEGENKTFDVKVTVNLEVLKLPNDEFDYQNLDLTKFASDYAVLYNIVEDMAKLSYKVDNDVTEAPADLVETLDGIKYFGFNEAMIGESIVDDKKDVDNNIIEIVYDALTENGVITLEEKLQTATDYGAAEKVTMENFDDNLRSELVDIINVAENKVRAEKLFIKDIILSGDDKYMEGIEKKNYVALIYLPKQSVDFEYVSYMITIDKTADFNMTLTNNGSTISLSKGEGENWGEDENAADLTYIFSSGKNLKQTANVTDVFNPSENLFSSDCSLSKVLTQANDYNLYLEETTDDNGVKVLTFKKGNMCLTFETDAEFTFNEEITY